MKQLLYLSILSTLLFGCNSPRIKGGKSTYTSAAGAKVEMAQSQDPKDKSGYKVNYSQTKEFVIPAGSKIIFDALPVGVDMPVSNAVSVVLSSNMPVKLITTETMDTTQGAAQKNVIGETIAKLNSMRPVQFVGIAVMLFGILSFVYPPLRAIVGSITTSIVIAATGLGMLVLPLIIVGNEVLILLVGVGIAVGYFFVYRYGGASAAIKLLKK